MQISGARVLITGASGGLGDAIARELARGGAQLTVTARRRDLLDGLAADTGAEVVVADLSDRDDVARLVDIAAGLDILVLNAGVGGDRDLRSETAERIDSVIDVNLRAPIQMSVAFAQHHLEAGTQAQIVFMGSLSGLAATPNTRMYNATKFGLRGFAHSLRQDLDGTGVGVSLVSPGFIRDAGMFAEGGMDLPAVIRTRSPHDVAAGVVRAIEVNPAEVFVSPIELRLTATLATVAPSFSAAVQRRFGVPKMKLAD